MKYSFKTSENMAMAYGRDLNMSTKQSVEICMNLRKKTLEKAKKILEKVIAKETPIRMSRYNKDTAHKKAIGPGKFPIKASTQILRILKSAESNAQNKGLSTKNLYIVHISVHKASRPWHFGRKRRRKMKRTHIEVVLAKLPETKEKK